MCELLKVWKGKCLSLQEAPQRASDLRYTVLFGRERVTEHIQQSPSHCEEKNSGSGKQSLRQGGNIFSHREVLCTVEMLLKYCNWHLK